MPEPARPTESGYYVAWTADAPGSDKGDYRIVMFVGADAGAGQPYFRRIGCPRQWSLSDSGSWSNKLPALLGSSGLHRLVGSLGCEDGALDDLQRQLAGARGRADDLKVINGALATSLSNCDERVGEMNEARQEAERERDEARAELQAELRSQATGAMGQFIQGIQHEREATLAHLRKWREAYPEDVFVPPPKPDLADKSDAAKERRRIGTVHAAAMARHVLDALCADIEAGAHIPDDDGDAEAGTPAPCGCGEPGGQHKIQCPGRDGAAKVSLGPALARIVVNGSASPRDHRGEPDSADGSATDG